MAKNNPKNLLPKRIAGVKVPKSVRKGSIAAALASPTGKAVLGEILMAAAAVAGAKKVKDSPKARNALADVADRLRQTGDGVGAGAAKATAAGAAVTFAVSEAARAFVDALESRRSETSAAPAPATAEGWTEAVDAESKKKPSSYEAVVPH